jgi:hypothetical protein
MSEYTESAERHERAASETMSHGHPWKATIHAALAISARLAQIEKRLETFSEVPPPLPPEAKALRLLQ